MFDIENVLAFIKANFFYDLKSSIISICLILAMFFLMRLLKDNGDKIYRSLKYLTCVVVFFGVVVLLY